MSDQLQMTYPEAPGFKAHGTSEESARKVSSEARTLREQVLDVFRFNGDMTADECAEHMGLSILSIRPRFSELRAMGEIEDSGVRRKNVSGHRAVVWKLSLQRAA